MELICLIFLVMCLFIGGVTAALVMFAMPVWALTDVAYARDLGEPSRTTLIVLISLSIGGFVLFCFLGGIFTFLLGPFAFFIGLFFVLVPLIYSCFLTQNHALKKAALVALTVLLVTGTGSVASGYGAYVLLQRPGGLGEDFFRSTHRVRVLQTRENK